MFHPILYRSGSRVGYLVAWTLVGIAQAIVLSKGYGFGWQLAAVDGATFGFLLGSLGLGTWNVVRYVNVEKQGWFNILFAHAAAAAVILSIWWFTGKWLLTMLFENETAYLDFLQNSLPWRCLVALLLYAILTMLYYLVMYYNNFQEKTQREMSLAASVKESELAMLRAQINPHFIFNSLNSISALTMSLPDRAQEMTIKLSDFLRYSLSQEGKQLTSLAEEMRTVNLYMDIEKTRFGRRLQYEQHLCAACASQVMPNMLLQPLFENAIKHGVYESTEQVTIRFTSAVEMGYLKLNLWNNFDPDAAPRKGNGLGLKNVQNRLELLYGRADLMQVDRTENTYEITLLIPQFG